MLVRHSHIGTLPALRTGDPLPPVESGVQTPAHRSSSGAVRPVVGRRTELRQESEPDLDRRMSYVQLPGRDLDLPGTHLSSILS